MKNLIIVCLTVIAFIQIFNYIKKKEGPRYIPAVSSKNIPAVESAQNNQGYMTKDYNTDDFLIVSSDNPIPISGSGISEFNIQTGFDPVNYLVPGVPNVIEICARKCGGCYVFRKLIEKFLQTRPDVAFRIILIPDDWRSSTMLKQYSVNINSKPHVLVYDAAGNLVAQDIGSKKSGTEYLFIWMKVVFESAGIDFEQLLKDMTPKKTRL